MARYGTGETLLDTHLEQAVTLLEDALRRARALGERYLSGVDRFLHVAILPATGRTSRASVGRWNCMSTPCP
jgi:hypothetical protein